MRKLSEEFVRSLQSGILKGLLEKVKQDMDLDLEIRDNSLNIYYKGNSLLKLDELRSSTPCRYRPTIHQKFLDGQTVSVFENEAAVHDFLRLIPTLKENILRFGRSSIETEYEQMIIRANNDELRNNSEYFMIDRQYNAGSSGRFDLTGFYWQREGRRKHQEVPICLIEIKYALNQDIQTLDEQISRYYEAIARDFNAFAEEAESVFQQKLALGLFHQSQDRLEALKTLKFSRDIRQVQLILFLIDYNPFSKRLDLEKLKGLPFANQIRMIQTGFALWEQKLDKLITG
jgi:hypothetical protein